MSVGAPATNTLLAILLATIAFLFAPFAMAQDNARPWPTREWSTSSPEEQGMSSERPRPAWSISAPSTTWDSGWWTRHGRIVLEATYAPFRAGLRHRFYSATKSVTSTLVGMALADGPARQHRPQGRGFLRRPQRSPTSTDAKKAITVQHLLDMTSGLAWQEGGTAAPNPTSPWRAAPTGSSFILDQPMTTPPGSRFYYTPATATCCRPSWARSPAAARSTTRGKAVRAARHRRRAVRVDPQGVPIGGNDLYLQPRDMAKIGYLWLRGRPVEGKQILPAAWIESVRSADIDMHESWSADMRYGRSSGSYAAPRHLHGGGLPSPARRRDARARHRGGGDGLVALRQPERPWRARRATASARLPGFLAAAVTSDGARRRQSRRDGRARRAGEGRRLRAAGAGQPRRAGGAGQGGVRQDLAVHRQSGAAEVAHLEAGTIPSRPTNTSSSSAPPWFRRARSGGPIGFDGHFRGGGRTQPGAERCARRLVGRRHQPRARGADAGRRRRRAG